MPRLRPRPRMGTTSACAENTYEGPSVLYSLRNYLRVRGEYVVVAWAEVSAVELPPRARRIPERHRKENHHAGTTSACAENTIGGRTPSCARGNYLRVRGEYR